MSAVAALHFDPVFSMGSRQSYSSWPVIESSQHTFLDLHPPYAPDTSVSPPSTARSAASSPPHYSLSLTPRERALKRHSISHRSTDSSTANIGLASIGIDLASPTSTTGSPSYLNTSPPAVAMVDLSSSSATGSLPGTYTSSAPTQMPLLSESAATTAAGLGSPPYYSPSIHDHAASQSVFSAASYQNQQYMPEYTTAPFAAAASASLHAQYPRTAMPDQSSMVYHIPPSHASLMGHAQQHQHHQEHQQQASAHHSSLPHPMASHHHGGSHQSSPPLSHIHHPRAQAQGQAHQQTHAHANIHAHAHVHAHAPHHHPHPYDGVVAAPGAAGGVRVVQSRPKPQCWEHGCNGRQFSTFSNLLRHQREKSGQAAKAVCPNCGAEFTRTTARNGHMQHDKCKQRQRS